jgi:hypothetical protein
MLAKRTPVPVVRLVFMRERGLYLAAARAMRRLRFTAFVGATALAVSMFWSAGQASAAHVACGDTITRDTTLDSDLVDCPKVGIVIGADNVTLDLGGHTIDGPLAPVPEGTGFDPSIEGVSNRKGHDGVTVEDGSITGFHTGVKLSGAHPSLPLPHDIPVSDLTIRSLTVSATLGLDGYPLERLTVERVAITSGSMSMYVSAANSSITMNTARSGFGPPGVHRAEGQTILGLEDSVFAGNSFTQGGMVVIGDDNLVRNNTARHFIDVGLGIYGDGNSVEKNLLRDGEATIIVDGDNRIEKNRTIESTGDGIRVEGGRSLLLKNRSDRSGRDGIRVNQPGSTLLKNTANRNRYYGIEAVRGVIDGGGNKARGNGNPLQCLNIECK